MHNSLKFSYRETRKNGISTVMRLVAPGCKANKVLINKRKYQFSWIVVWQVTRNRQIFPAVGNFLVEKKPLPRPAQQFIPEVSKCRIIWLTSQILYTQQWKHLDDFIFNYSLVCLPKTRKRSRTAANILAPTNTADVANVLLRLLLTKFWNGFSELISTDSFSL